MADSEQITAVAPLNHPDSIATPASYSQRTFVRRTGKKRISDFEFRIADLKNKYEIRSDELREEISSRYGNDVELMNLKHGIFPL